MPNPSESLTHLLRIDENPLASEAVVTSHLPTVVQTTTQRALNWKGTSSIVFVLLPRF